MSTSSGPCRVDVVVVSYHNRDTLRDCVAPLAALDGVSVTVVDNDSSDGSLESIADLDVRAIQSGRNGGYAFGCNIGARAGSAPYVLILNPDARLGESDLKAMMEVLDREPGVGMVGPRLIEEDGELAYSQRRFPRLRSTFAQALYLHRVFPNAAWSDELIRDRSSYERPGSPDWISGACMLVRRDALEQIDGLDEGFFLYCEDIDICRRLRDAGYDIRFEPAATVHHVGGASRPSSELRVVLATSRVRYARLHRGRIGALMEKLGIALGEATHVLGALNRPAVARGHAAALRSLMATDRQFEKGSVR